MGRIETIQSLLGKSKVDCDVVGKMIVTTVTLPNGFSLTEARHSKRECMERIRDRLYELEAYAAAKENKEPSPALTPKDRVEIELNELRDKSGKLSAALYRFEWNAAEAYLLNEQLRTMNKYEEILLARLSIWRDDIPKYDQKVGMVEAVKECDK